MDEYDALEKALDIICEPISRRCKACGNPIETFMNGDLDEFCHDRFDSKYRDNEDEHEDEEGDYDE